MPIANTTATIVTQEESHSPIIVRFRAGDHLLKRVTSYRIQDDHKSGKRTGEQTQAPLNEMTNRLTEPLEGPS